MRERSVMSSFFKRKIRSSSQHKTSEDLHLTKRRNKNSKNLHLFLCEIMRKLKHSFKKEKKPTQQQQHDKTLSMKKKKKRFHFHKSLSTKDHFFFERMISRSHCYKMLLKNGDFDQYNQRRIVSVLPEYSSPFSSPGRIWEHSSTTLSRSTSEDEFIKSETITDEDYDEEKESEILKEKLSLLSMASPTEEYKLVLDSLFIEYEINPTRGEAFCSMDAKDSVFNYVKAVLDAIDSNLEDLYLKTEFSDQLLNPALISNISFYPNQLCLDHELLFDCINEVLFEFCSFPPWIKPETRIFSFSIQSIIHEVQKEVYFHLLPLRIAYSLDEIVVEDIAQPGNWLDIGFDLEWIGFEMSELILNELLEELMLDL